MRRRRRGGRRGATCRREREIKAEESRERGHGWSKKMRERVICGPHQMVVGIEERYRVWMSAAKLNIKERIFMTRHEYSF